MDDISALDSRHVWHPFTQAQTAGPAIPVVSAKGTTLVGADGKRYLDVAASWWTNLHGHAHPAIAEAIATQARTLEQVIFADFTHAPAARLAAGVANLLPGDLSRVFYSDDGSTAVEVALKMALQFWANEGQAKRTRIVAFEGAYHGDTVGAMSAGATSGYFRAWQHMLFPVTFVPYPATFIGDDAVAEKETAALAFLKASLDDTVAAVIIEPLVQGASGMRMVRPEFMRAMADIVQASGALLIYDEVMTGFGRTGDLFACLASDTKPDMVCLSKGLTGGFLPLSMTVTTQRIFHAFLGETVETAFLHGHSYTANPIACAAALASLELLTAPDCRTAIERIGRSHRAWIERIAGNPLICHPRQTGTTVAFDIAGASGYGAAVGQHLKRFCMERGVVLRPLGNVIYLLPPYCISDDELATAYDVIEQAVAALADAAPSSRDPRRGFGVP